MVHVSQLADRFVKDPHEVVKAGDVVKVRVTEVDVPRKRIGLSMRKDGGAAAESDAPRQQKDNTPRGQRGAKPAKPVSQPSKQPSADSQGALGAALLQAMRGKT